MKKIILIITILVLAAGLVAHPAKKLSLKTDLKNKTLSVIYHHSVKNNTFHYIDKVLVEINGKKIIEQSLTTQNDNKAGELVYTIPEMKLGSEIKVLTRCNKGGKKNGSVTVKVKAADKSKPVKISPKKK